MARRLSGSRGQSCVRTQTYCCRCGTCYVLWRVSTHRKAMGHIKHVYCTRCRRVTPHQESRPLQRGSAEGGGFARY